MKVICSVCEKNAKFNTTLGIYYCPSHGYETKLENMGEHIGEMVQNLEQMKAFV